MIFLSFLLRLGYLSPFLRFTTALRFPLSLHPLGMLKFLQNLAALVCTNPPTPTPLSFIAMCFPDVDFYPQKIS